MQAYYQEGGGESGSEPSPDEYYQERVAAIRQSNVEDVLIVLCGFAIALDTLISNYSYMKKREHESALQLGMERLRANTDALTGVKSKHMYAEKEQELDFAITRGRNPEFAIAVCDLNGMKEINDKYGHSAGDDYIKEACKLVCQTFKHSPVYRIGGDEFVAVLEGSDYRDRESLIAIMDDRAEANALIGGPVVAAGMATFDPQRDTSALTVFERADERMYERKSALKLKQNNAQIGEARSEA